VRNGDRVLLVRHSYARRDLWDLPGGFVRPGEPPEDALRRELAEELAVTPRAVRAIGALPMRNDSKREVIHAFAVDVDSETVRPHPAELDDVRWVERDALPPGTSRFVRRLVARAYWELWDDDD
jgi:ADP-ribose pyrophosphatase YjhB (NUDIX family)